VIHENVVRESAESTPEVAEVHCQNLVGTLLFIC